MTRSKAAAGTSSNRPYATTVTEWTTASTRPKRATAAASSASTAAWSATSVVSTSVCAPAARHSCSADAQAVRRASREHQPVTAAGAGQRGGPADAARPAGDHDDPADPHPVLPSTASGSHRVYATAADPTCRAGPDGCLSDRRAGGRGRAPCRDRGGSAQRTPPAPRAARRGSRAGAAASTSTIPTASRAGPGPKHGERRRRRRSRPARPGRAGRRGSAGRPARAVGSAGRGRSSRPRSTRPNSSPSDGNTMIPPATTATTTATSVEVGAAASATVSPGSTSGRWATAQPATIAATAAPAANRAGSSRRRQTRPSVNSPAAPRRSAPASPAPVGQPVEQPRRVGAHDHEPARPRPRRPAPR